MRKMKKLLAIAVATSMLVTFASGFTSTTQKSAAPKVTLKYTYWGGAMEKKSTDAQIKLFESLHPDVKIVAQQIPTNYLTKLNTMAASNTLPDIGYMQESSVLSWAQKGMFLSLDDINKYGKVSKRLDSVAFKLNGKTVAYSVADEIMVLYYNKDLFKKAGVEAPPANAAKAWNWDKLIEVAQKLTVDKNGKHPTDAGFDEKNIVTYGINVPKWDMPLYSFIFSNGGGLVSKDGKQLAFDNQATIDAIQKMADLTLKYHVAPSPAQSSSIPSTDTALLTGKVAMAIDGQWALQILGQAKQTSKLNFGIGVLPKMVTSATTNAGTAIAIFKSTKHAKEAVEFYNFLMNPDQSIDFITSGLWMPTEDKWFNDPNLINKWTGNNNVNHPAEYKTAVIDYASKNTVQEPWYNVTCYQQLMDVINPGLDQVWLGKKTAQDAVKNDIMPKLKPIFNGK